MEEGATSFPGQFPGPQSHMQDIICILWNCIYGHTNTEVCLTSCVFFIISQDLLQLQYEGE